MTRRASASPPACAAAGSAASALRLLGLAALLLSGCTGGSTPAANTWPSAAANTASNAAGLSIRIVQPPQGASVQGDSTVVEVEYAAPGGRINANSFHASINGQDATGLFDQHSRGVTGHISLSRVAGLGENRLAVEVADANGKVARAEITFVYSGSGWLTLRAVVHASAGRLRSVAISPDGTTLATAGEEGMIQFWDLKGAQAQGRTAFKAHRKSVTVLAFSPDGKLLASGSDDASVRLWKTASTDTAPFATLRGHFRSVGALAFSPDGKTLASGARDGSVRLWEIGPDAARGKAELKGHLLDVLALAFSADGRTLISGGYDQIVRLWDPGKPGPAEAANFAAPADALALSRDGKVLACALPDGKVQLWDLDGSKSQKKQLIEGFAKPAIRIVFGADDKELIAVSADGQVMSWDVGTASKQHESRLPHDVVSASWSQAAQQLATAYDSGVIYVMQLL